MERLPIASRRYITRLAAAVVLGLALALVTGAGSPAATGSSVNIAPKAHLWPFTGGRNGIIVDVTVVCTGGLGTVTVRASEAAADSGEGVPATGTQSETVNCDGSPHKVSVSIQGTLTFNRGTATADATLTAGSGNATDTRTIQIVST
jgi:hypothetical protein